MLLSIAIIISSAAAFKKQCQAERLLEKIQSKYEKIREDGGQCAEINFQHHNLCSILLAKTFTQR